MTFEIIFVGSYREAYDLAEQRGWPRSTWRYAYEPMQLAGLCPKTTTKHQFINYKVDQDYLLAHRWIT